MAQLLFVECWKIKGKECKNFISTSHLEKKKIFLMQQLMYYNRET